MGPDRYWSPSLSLLPAPSLISLFSTVERVSACPHDNMSSPFGPYSRSGSSPPLCGDPLSPLPVWGAPRDGWSYPPGVPFVRSFRATGRCHLRSSRLTLIRPHRCYLGLSGCQSRSAFVTSRLSPHHRCSP